MDYVPTKHQVIKNKHFYVCFIFITRSQSRKLYHSYSLHRYSEKQAKLLRLKANRKYILDRCEKLLLPKLKKDTLLTETKQSRDRVDLLRLAIEQRRSNIEEKRKELNELKNYNNELRLKLPR